MSSKKLAMIAIVGFLALGVIGFFVYQKKQNAEGLRGVPVPVSGVENEVVGEWVTAFQEVLKKDEVLQKIVTDSEYSAKLEVPEAEAVAHLRSAVRVSHNRPRKALVIGLMGKKKDQQILDEISRMIFNVSAPHAAIQQPSFGRYYQKMSEKSQ